VSFYFLLRHNFQRGVILLLWTFAMSENIFGCYKFCR
jgi:hypothetical protein